MPWKMMQDLLKGCSATRNIMSLNFDRINFIENRKKKNLNLLRTKLEDKVGSKAWLHKSSFCPTLIT